MVVLVVVLVDGGQKWSARVHRDDVAMGTEALLRDGAPGQPYILTDGQSFQVREMVSWLLEQAPSIPKPTVMSLEEYAKQRPYAASFWRNSNRYSNRAIASLPGFKLIYVWSGVDLLCTRCADQLCVPVQENL